MILPENIHTRNCDIVAEDCRSCNERSSFRSMKNYSFSFKLFVPFCILLMLITIVYIIVYDNSVINSSRAEIGKNCIGKLKVAETTVQEFKNTVRKDIIRLSVNSSVNELSKLSNNRSNGEWNSGDLAKLSDALKVILEAVQTNGRYESIYLYLEEIGYTLTSNQGFVPIGNLRDKGWLEHYNNYKSDRIPLGWIDTRLPAVSDEYQNYLASASVVTYIYPLTPYTTTLRGALVVNIKEDVFAGLVNTDDVNSEGYIYIINRNGNVISHIDKNYLCRNISDIDYVNEIINSNLNEGYLITEIDGERSLVSYYKSQTNGWIYMGVFSLESLIDSVNRTRMNIIRYSVLITILSIASAYLISKKLSSPVKKLIQDIKLNRGINILEAGDEMTVLRRAFESLSNELEKSKVNVMQNYLSNFLKGKIIYQEYNNILENLNFQHPYFLCAVMIIDDYDEFSSRIEVNRQYYLKVLILNIAEQVIGSYYRCKGVNMENGELALIINVDYKYIRELSDRLHELFRAVQKETAKILDYTVSTGIGRCYGDMNEIPTSYMEAAQALKMKLIYGRGSIIEWNDNFEKHKYYYPVNIEKCILNQIETGNAAAIEESVTRLMDDLRNKSGLSSDNVKQIFNQLVGATVIKYLTDSGIDMSHVFGSSFNIYNELSRKETLEDIKVWLIDTYRTMIEYLLRLKSDSDGYITKIMDYIHKNYRRDIGIQDIADYIGISYSHVRKIFKEKTGKNIIDFINGLRIKESKELLVNTDISIKDLALSVGYNSNQTFNRIFKKAEGITPGEYRDKARNALKVLTR